MRQVGILLPFRGAAGGFEEIDMLTGGGHAVAELQDWIRTGRRRVRGVDLRVPAEFLDSGLALFRC